jgi:geranylgeranyl diphosphate synthase type II
MSITARLEVATAKVITRAQGETAPAKLAQALHYAVTPGGAHIRPTILYSVAAACGDDRPALTDAAAVALELIHCASLVHLAFSEPLAVLTGDSLIVLAFDVLAEAAGSDAMRALNLIRVLSRRTGMPDGICAGQGWESESRVNLSAYHRAKTGALFIAATQMGAIAAGQDAEPWEELGARIGEAFQVADDLRDALYDSETLGKPAGQDAAHDRPNAVQELGVQGAIRRLKDILGGAIASIPSCKGEAMLADMVRRYAERMTPVAPAFSQAAVRG